MAHHGYLSVPGVILVILILTDSCSSSGSSKTLPAASTPEKALQWYDAYLSCRSRHQTLLTPPPALSADLLHQWLPSDGARVWLGGRFVHTAWRWADGCGVERMEGCVSVSRLPLPQGHFASEDPFDCLIKCGTPFVALQGKGCQCLRSEPRHRVKVTRCDTRCANNLDQFCGGLHRYASIYSMQPSSVKWDRGGEKVDGDCAFLHLPTQSSVGLPDVRIRTDACDERITGGYKRHLCQKCSSRNDQCEVTRHRGYVTWLDASADCRKEGGQLLNVRTNRSLPLLFHPYISEDYWIGLKRDFVLKWINGSVVMGDQLTSPVVKEGGFCLTASRVDNTSHITFTAVDCALKLPFFCAPDPHRKPVIPQDLSQSEFCRSPLFTPHTPPSSLPPSHHLPSLPQQPLTTPGSESSTMDWNTSETSRAPSEFQETTTNMRSVSTSQYKASSRPLTGHNIMKTSGVQVSHTSKQPAAHTTFVSSVSVTLRATSSLKSSRFLSVFMTFRTPPYTVTSKTSLLLLTSDVSSLQTTSRTPLSKVSSHTPKSVFPTEAVERTSTGPPTEHVEPHTTERSDVSSTLKKNHKLQSKTSQNPKILTTLPKSERPTTLTRFKSPLWPTTQILDI